MASVNTVSGYYNVPGPISTTATVVADYHAIGGNTTGGFTQQTTQTGLASMQMADTIYQQIADFQLGQDQSLQNALAQFAAAASGGAPSTGLGTQFGTA